MTENSNTPHFISYRLPQDISVEELKKKYQLSENVSLGPAAIYEQTTNGGEEVVLKKDTEISFPSFLEELSTIRLKSKTDKVIKKTYITSCNEFVCLAILTDTEWEIQTYDLNGTQLEHLHSMPKRIFSKKLPTYRTFRENQSLHFCWETENFEEDSYYESSQEYIPFLFECGTCLKTNEKLAFFTDFRTTCVVNREKILFYDTVPLETVFFSAKSGMMYRNVHEEETLLSQLNLRIFCQMSIDRLCFKTTSPTRQRLFNTPLILEKLKSILIDESARYSDNLSIQYFNVYENQVQSKEFDQIQLGEGPVMLPFRNNVSHDGKSVSFYVGSYEWGSDSGALRETVTHSTDTGKWKVSKKSKLNNCDDLLMHCRSSGYHTLETVDDYSRMEGYFFKHHAMILTLRTILILFPNRFCRVSWKPELWENSRKFTGIIPVTYGSEFTAIVDADKQSKVFIVNNDELKVFKM